MPHTAHIDCTDIGVDDFEKVLEEEGQEVVYAEELDLETLREYLTPKPKKRKSLDREAAAQPISNQLKAKSERRRRRSRQRAFLAKGVFVHVTSRIHLQRRLLVEDKAKEILATLCYHYAKLCEIELHHYCVMDNHLHLVLRIRAGSRDLGRMIADIKRQFTKAYKAWFNDEYRRSIRYRVEKLGKGTLWDGPYHAEIIEDTRQLTNACFYVEANRLKVIARNTIIGLTQPPSPPLEQEGNCDEPYAVLIELARSYGFQSARFYLDGCQGHDPFLTDGTDAQWASPEEIKEYWSKPARDLPRGWRRVWYDGKRAILKPTPTHARSYPDNPLWKSLGNTPSIRATNFGRLLMEACWRGRAELEGKPLFGRYARGDIPGA